MRFEGLDLNLLAALEVLMDCRSTTETARRLNLSQPAISAALGRLREYFDDDLLMNMGRGMVPTPKAEELAPAITELLNIARFRIVHADDFDPSTTRRCFKILCSDYAFDLIVAGTLAKAAALAPRAAFEIGTTGPEGARLFQKGEIDLMITVPNYIFKDHPSQTLFTDMDAVICWSEGRLARGITRDQFLQAEFAEAVFGEERRPSISKLHFREQGVALNAVLQVPSFSALPKAISGTNRLAVMHRGHAKLFEQSHPIISHALPIAGPNVREVAQWHRLRRNDSGIQWLIDILRKEVVERSEAIGISSE